MDEKCSWLRQYFNGEKDISSPIVITSYFNSLYGWNGQGEEDRINESHDRLDEKRILPIIANIECGGKYIQYRKIAGLFRYIDDRDRKLIFVPNEENMPLCEELREDRINRKLLSTLSKDMVSLKNREYTELLKKEC